MASILYTHSKQLLVCFARLLFPFRSSACAPRPRRRRRRRPRAPRPRSATRAMRAGTTDQCQAFQICTQRSTPMPGHEDTARRGGCAVKSRCGRENAFRTAHLSMPINLTFRAEHSIAFTLLVTVELSSAFGMRSNSVNCPIKGSICCLNKNHSKRANL